MRLDVYVFVIVLGFECIVVSCCKVGVRTSDLMVRQRMWLGKFMLKFTEVGEGKFMECSGNVTPANNWQSFQGSLRTIAHACRFHFRFWRLNYAFFLRSVLEVSLYAAVFPNSEANCWVLTNSSVLL